MYSSIYVLSVGTIKEERIVTTRASFYVSEFITRRKLQRKGIQKRKD